MTRRVCRARVLAIFPTRLGPTSGVLRVGRILTDDDPGAAALIASGHRLVTTSPANVLARLASEHPAVVVVEAAPGDDEAAALCRAVRASAEGRDVPLVVLAAAPPTAHEHAALLEAGAQLVLAGPPPSVLVAAVRSLASLAAGRPAAPPVRGPTAGAALGTTAIGIVELERRTQRFLRVDERVCEMTGRTRDELLAGPSLPALAHPDDRAGVETALARLQAGGASDARELRLLRRDGTVAWVHVAAVASSGRNDDEERTLVVLVDLTALQHAGTALAGERERLTLAQRAGRIGMVDWDVPSGLMVWNERQEAIAGLSPGTFGGTVEQAVEHVLPDDLARLRTIAATALVERRPQVDVGIRIRRGDGALRELEAAARLVYDEDDRPVRVVGVTVDVTERREAERERERALAAAETARAGAEAANRAKDDFLAMLGHELRNPLAAVHGAVLTATLDPGHAARALDIAKRQSEQLARIVDDLVDVARIAQGRVALRRERTDLCRLVDRAIGSCRALVASRHHALAFTAPREPLEVDVDPGRLEQVVVNLVSNAARFTDPGGKIQVSVARQDDDVELRVRDTGVGISRELLPRVFDLFAQAERTPDRPQGGLGVGLTVARRLVELHGGRIEAHSPGRGLGAEFVVRLPAAAPLPVQPAGGEGPDLAPRRTRVLVVEDNVDAAESMQMLLELLGHEVRVAYDGLSAIEAAQAEQPDIMLVDIGLPGIDGYEVARRLRAQPALAGTHIVAVTGFGREEDRQRALSAGFDDHLVKPVGLDVLRNAVGRPPAEGDRGARSHAS